MPQFPTDYQPNAVALAGSDLLLVYQAATGLIKPISATVASSFFGSGGGGGQAGTLTGTTLAANVVASSLTSAAGGAFGTAAFTASTDYATAAQGAIVTAATDAATASTLVKRDGSGSASLVGLTLTSGTVSSAPANPTDIANKAYVDLSVSMGLVIHTPCRVLEDSPVTLVGGAPKVVDSITLAQYDRVLVKGQSDDKENGIYSVATLGSGSNGTWTRATDADTGAKLCSGSYSFISAGTVYMGSSWVMTTLGVITLGSSHILWTQFNSATSVLAANIVGQILQAQIADAAINTAKFATGLTPVELLAALPTVGNSEGRTVYLTTDGKLYRYHSGAFTSATPTTDLTGQISAGQIAANAVTAGTIAVNAVTAGTISAGAVNTAELAAGAVNASKIYGGSITSNELAANAVKTVNLDAYSVTAGKISVASLSAISANLGTVTAGTISASTSISLATANNAVSIDSTGMTVAGGYISFKQNTNGYASIRVTGTGSGYTGAYVDMNAGGSSLPPMINYYNFASGTLVTISEGGISVSGSAANITVASGSNIKGAGNLKIVQGSGDGLNVVAGEAGSAGALAGYMTFNLNGRLVAVPFYYIS